MKVLYLFIVYRSPEIVIRTIERLDSRDSLFMIHVDANSKYDFSALSKYPNVRFATKRYPTPWGGPELALAVFDALKEASSSEWDYVCLLSESDYPVKTPQYISSYLANSGKDHILINTLPCDNPLETLGGHWLEGGRRRTDCYALRLTPKQIATVEPRKINLGNIRQFIKILKYKPIRIIDALKIFTQYPKRTRTTDVLCGGHQWFFLKRRTTDVIIDYVDNNPEFLRECVHTQCLDEIFFPTLVNQVADSKNISKNILRYISWANNGSSSPVDITIDEKNKIDHLIDNPDILLVRKISSLDVCDYIDREIQARD